jgi:hypothetical protein
VTAYLTQQRAIGILTAIKLKKMEYCGDLLLEFKPLLPSWTIKIAYII